MGANVATREQLEKALRAADAAGDESAARRFAAELKTMAPSSAPAPAASGPLQALDDMLRLASNGLTLGGRDALANYLRGGTREEENAKSDAARERAGGAGTVAELGGAMIPSMLMPNLAPAALARIPAAAPVTRALTTLGLGGLEGSALGGIESLFDGENPLEGIMSGAVFGGAGAAASGLLSKGGNMLAGLFGKNPSRLSVDDLRMQKDAAYRNVDNIGVEYTPGTVRGVLADVDDATRTAYPGRHDKVIATRDAVRDRLGTTSRPVNLTEMDLNRQIINRDVSGIMDDPAQQGFGIDMANAMDNRLSNVGPLGVTARSGDPEDGLEALNNARSLNTRMRKLEQVEDTIDAATRQADRNLQSGEDSTIRSKLDAILGSPKRRRGFSDDEVAKMEEIVRGSTEQNLMRQAGRMAPGGGFNLGGTGLGAAAGSVFGIPGAIAGAAVPSAVGILAKKASERSTKKAADDLLTLIASGGNAAAIRKPQVMNKDAEKMLARFFTQLGLQDD